MTPPLVATMLVAGWSAGATAVEVPASIPCDQAKIEMVVTKAGVERIRTSFSPQESTWSSKKSDGVYKEPKQIHTDFEGKTRVDDVEMPRGTFVNGLALCHDDIVIVKATVEHISVLGSREVKVGDAAVSLPQVEHVSFDTSFVWKPTSPLSTTPAFVDDLEISMRLMLP